MTLHLGSSGSIKKERPTNCSRGPCIKIFSVKNLDALYQEAYDRKPSTLYVLVEMEEKPHAKNDCRMTKSHSVAIKHQERFLIRMKSQIQKT